MGTLRDDAIRYTQLGYPVFPCVPGEKRPLVSGGFHRASTDVAQIQEWWGIHPNANIATPTEGLTVVDVDGPDNPWPGDPRRKKELVGGPFSLTPGGGRHYYFRQPLGKAWRCTTSALAPHVDTRADGGYILLPSSVVDGKRYRWAHSTQLEVGPDGISEPPDWLVSELDKVARKAHGPGRGDGTSLSAGFLGGDGSILEGQRNDTLAHLAGVLRHYGMSRAEILAALEQVNVDRCDPPLSTCEVEMVATSISKYPPNPAAAAWSASPPVRGQVGEAGCDRTASELLDPGPTPAKLLRVPGFISEVMDYCLATAPYPNTPLAFGGALALQSVLAGRKVCDVSNIRTNVYLLLLANSAAGKDRPRQVNVEVLHAIGLLRQLGGKFASGEAIEDALLEEPCMLFQTDEIDGMLRSINMVKESRYEAIMGTLQTMYTSAGSKYFTRRKAGKASPGVIDQPCLSILGTATPRHYYEALTERMLSNGFFGRMNILDCCHRGRGKEPHALQMPDAVLETAKRWAGFHPGAGDGTNWCPEPIVVCCTPSGRKLLAENREEADAEYEEARERGDEAGMTVWGRAHEHVRKLALIHAVSEWRGLEQREPKITKAAVEWAGAFIMHQIRRMLFMAESHVADNRFDAQRLKFKRMLRSAPNHEVAHSDALRRMRMRAKDFHSLVGTLLESGEIVERLQPGAGRPGRYYRLAGEAREASQQENGSG